MKRRNFLAAGSLAVATAAGLASAQRAPQRRVTWASTDAALGNLGFAAFKDGLGEHGYVDGRDVTVSTIAFNGPQEAQERMALELGQRNPDLVVTQGPVVRTLHKVGTPLPVVFGFSGDPVAAGLVESFARPGRNMTGISFLAFDLVAKRMEFLKALLPDLRRVAIVANPGHPGEPEELRVSKSAAAALSLSVDYFQIRGADELDGVFDGVRAARSQAIVLFPDAGMMRLSERFAAFGREHRVPAVSGWTIFAERGNVLSYGPDLESCFRRLAFYADRIFKGAKPADIPVELPTKVSLAINLQAAKAIGLAVSPSLLSRADKVFA